MFFTNWKKFFSLKIKLQFITTKVIQDFIRVNIFFVIKIGIQKFFVNFRDINFIFLSKCFSQLYLEKKTHCQIETGNVFEKKTHKDFFDNDDKS